MQFEKIRETLKQIGLGHNESKIYLTLLKLGSSMAGKIAKEANVDRSACYDSLKALIKKGLVKYVLEANRKMFSAEDPRRLVDFLKEKEEMVGEVLDDLKNLYYDKKDDSQVTMYRGYNGLKSVFEDILKEAKENENLVIDSSGRMSDKMPYYVHHYIKGLEKNKITVRHIVRRSRKPGLNPSKTTVIRSFPKDIKETIITTNIYAGKIAMILWSDIPEAVIIQNKAAYIAYKDYFEILWARARES